MGDFTFAAWNQWPRDFPAWRDRGVSVFLANHPVPQGTTRADYIAAAWNAGAEAGLLPSDDPLYDDINLDLWTFVDEPFKWGALIRRLEVPAAAPTVERFDVDATVDRYIALRQRLREVDPEVPVFVNYDHLAIDAREVAKVGEKENPVTLGHFRRMLAAFDENDPWGFDFHGLSRGQTMDVTLLKWKRIAERMRELGARGPLWMSIETGPHLPTAKPFGAAEVRVMAQFAREELKAEGIVWFSTREPAHGFNRDVTSLEVSAEITRLEAEFNTPPTELEQLRAQVESLSADLAKEREASAVAAEVLQAAVVREAAALEKIRNAREALG